MGCFSVSSWPSPSDACFLTSFVNTPLMVLSSIYNPLVSPAALYLINLSSIVLLSLSKRQLLLLYLQFFTPVPHPCSLFHSWILIYLPCLIVLIMVGSSVYPLFCYGACWFEVISRISFHCQWLTHLDLSFLSQLQLL